MRTLMSGVVAIGLLCGACRDADRSLNVSAQNAPTAAPESTPVATAGRASAGEAVPAPDAARTPAAVRTSAEPAWREVTLPAGTSLAVMLDDGVGSDTSRIEQRVDGHLAHAVVVRGQPVIPAGSPVSGVVTSAVRSGKVKGRAHVAVRFDTLTPRGDDERYRFHASPVARTAAATKKNDAIKIGAPAAGGAIIGGIIGGKKGALIGTAAGGGAGTAVVMSTRGKEVHLPKGATYTVHLTEPLTVRIRG